MQPFGEETSEQLARIPARLFVKQHAQTTPPSACRIPASTRAGRADSGSTSATTSIRTRFSPNAQPRRPGQIPREVQRLPAGRCVQWGKTVIEVACWAHARRKFFEARESDARADEMLLLIGDMYAVEKEACEYSPNLRRDVRQLTAPILERIGHWMNTRAKEVQKRIGRGNSLRAQPVARAGAVHRRRHSRTRQQRRRECAATGGAGKKELFVRRQRCGWIAHSDSLFAISSCKRHSVDPIQYLTDVLTRIATHPASRVGELAPANWKTNNVTPA
jgi:hypothetical protein